MSNVVLSAAIHAKGHGDHVNECHHGDDVEEESGVGKKRWSDFLRYSVTFLET